jgi:L-amino acid N-acyltransferase YncA
MKRQLRGRRPPPDRRGHRRQRQSCSIKLHERFGFERVGMLPAVGYKFGRWVDSVLMQKEIGEGSHAPPA